MSGRGNFTVVIQFFYQTLSLTTFCIIYVHSALYLHYVKLPIFILLLSIFSSEHWKWLITGRGYRGNRNRNQQTLSSVARETALSLPADSPVLAMFKTAARQLNERQDRHERLVKLSRDITIESKRIIFLLHSAITWVWGSGRML